MASGSEPSEGEAEAGRGAQPAGRVLLVDDSKLVRDFVGGLISDWGFKVEAVETGQAALAAIEAATFDVVVSDITMPGMSGLDLLTTLRMRAPALPVIMLSSLSRTSEILCAIHQGAFDYVVKDEAIEPLRLALVRAVERVRLVAENARLVAQLGHLNQDLERRVLERTAELEAANARLSSERREMETAMLRLNDTQEQLVQIEKMASIGLLTAGVAHEINNPLGFLLPNFELIEAWLACARAGKKHERVQTLDDLDRLVSECRQGLDRIARLVRQLRIFSHPGRQAWGQVDVDAVIRSVVGLVEREISGKAAINVYSNHDCVARGSEDQLRQVLLNLVVNSAQSFPGPSSDGRIDIVVERKDDDVLVRVIDNGCGITPENLRRVFDPFFTTKAVGHGTGLGLAISRDLVKKMGGNITLESQLGRGTSVTIALHAWRSEPEDQKQVEPPHTPTPEILSPNSVRRLSIIIVEDEPSLLQPLRRMLSDRHDVLTFSDSRDGMRCLIDREPPDVIICDINMPEVSGVELYRAVSKVRPFLAERFIFLTGGDPEEVAGLISESPRRILEKPVHRKDLIEAIEAVAASRAGS